MGGNPGVGNGEDGEPVLGEVQPLRLAFDDVYAERGEEAQDAPRFRRAGRVVVPGDDDDDGAGEGVHQARELSEGEEDRRVGWADVVEDVAGDEDEIGGQRDDAIHHPAEDRGDVGLALVFSSRRLPLELAIAEVEVGEVNEPHDRVADEPGSGGRVSLGRGAARRRHVGGPVGRKYTGAFGLSHFDPPCVSGGVTPGAPTSRASTG